MNKSAAYIICLLFSCYSTERIFFRYRVAYDYIYYSFSEAAESPRQVPQAAYWDYTGDRHIIYRKPLYLFSGNRILDESYWQIRSGELDRAIDFLEKNLPSIPPGSRARALAHNNLAVAQFLANHPESALFHINQAGLIDDSNREILKNARLITAVLQNKIMLVKP